MPVEAIMMVKLRPGKHETQFDDDLDYLYGVMSITCKINADPDRTREEIEPHIMKMMAGKWMDRSEVLDILSAMRILRGLHREYCDKHNLLLNEHQQPDDDDSPHAQVFGKSRTQHDRSVKRIYSMLKTARSTAGDLNSPYKMTGYFDVELAKELNVWGDD